MIRSSESWEDSLRFFLVVLAFDLLYHDATYGLSRQPGFGILLFTFTQTLLRCYELLILGLWILLTREKRVYLSVMPVYFTTLYDSYIIIPSMDLLCPHSGSSYGSKRQVIVTRHCRSEPPFSKVM